MRDATRRYWMVRALLAAVVLIGLPTVLSVPAFLSEAPIRVGEPSPRTVLSPRLVRVDDVEATERARREAADSVDPVLQFDPQAQTAVVSQVRDWFAIVFEVRSPAEADGDQDEPIDRATPSPEEQLDALRSRLPMLDEDGRRLLVNMSDSRLDRVRDETVDIAQQLARQRIREQDIERILTEDLRTELAVRDLSTEVADAVVEPMLRSALRPTVTLDEEATERQRREAAANVSDVVRSFPAGTVIISAGEEASPVQVAALERVGLAGADPRWELLRAFGVVLVAMVLLGTYLRTYRPRIWGSNRDLLLISVLMFAYAALLGAVAAGVDRNEIWLHAVPSGALAMLVTVLLSPPVGVLIVVPMVLLVALVSPAAPGIIAYTAATALISVPFVTRLSARGDLRRATLYSALGYIALAGVFSAVFLSLDEVPLALLAGAIHGVSAAVIVLGGLPFLESGFRIVTATSLIDLADRNHPLLRELEQKALGSYNHSIVVATLVERACRAIGADGLLGSVCALYHDIGKVARPYFFVENQFGVRNPHEDLEPRVSARIIQKHVDDGIEMATEHHLPPEVVDGIATHHGTTLVTYFYLEAVRAADPEETVEERAFRYKGRKPNTKETAVLMLADCCEAASRAAAQNDRNLTRTQLVDLVEALTADRVDDGQLDESPLTFQDLAEVKASFIETLVGVYHPRVAYPEGEKQGKRTTAATRRDDGGSVPDDGSAPPDAAPPASAGAGVPPVSPPDVSGNGGRGRSDRVAGRSG